MKPSILGWLIAILLMSSSASARADNCGPTIRLWQGFVTASLITVPKRGDLTPKLAYDLGVAREWEKCHNFLALGFAIGVDTEGDVGPAIFLAEGSHWFSDKIAAGVNLVGWVDVSFARGWEAIGAGLGPQNTHTSGGGGETRDATNIGMVVTAGWRHGGAA